MDGKNVPRGFPGRADGRGAQEPHRAQDGLHHALRDGRGRLRRGGGLLVPVVVSEMWCEGVGVRRHMSIENMKMARTSPYTHTYFIRHKERRALLLAAEEGGELELLLLGLGLLIDFFVHIVRG